jgi:hypothetical protein
MRSPTCQAGSLRAPGERNRQLVAVMASPPWQVGVGQDVGSTTATSGKTQASTVVEGQSLGVSVGYSVGFEYESDLFQAGVSAKTTFEAAFDFFANLLGLSTKQGSARGASMDAATM